MSEPLWQQAPPVEPIPLWQQAPELEERPDWQKAPPVEEPGFWELVLPRFIQEGYNRSIMGLADQIITGEQRFDLSGYDPSTLEDIGATVASFLMPVDFLLTVGTGGLASIPAKALAKRTAAQLVKSGIKGQVAKKVAQSGVTRAVQGASVLGVYSGTQSALAQEAEFGEIDPGEVTKAALRGTVTGAIAGGAGGAIAGRFAARAEAAAKIAGSEVITIRPLEKAVEVAGEIVAFGTAAPALEMRFPTGQDYLHAAGVILGLRAVHATASTGMKALRKSLATDIKIEVEQKGFPIEEATEAVGERRVTEVQAQRAIEEPVEILGRRIEAAEPTSEALSIAAKRRYAEDIILDPRRADEMPALQAITGVSAARDYPGLLERVKWGRRGKSPVGATDIVVRDKTMPQDYDLIVPEELPPIFLSKYGLESVMDKSTGKFDFGKLAELAERELQDVVYKQGEYAAGGQFGTEYGEPGVPPIDIPTEVQSVREVFAKQEADIRASNKTDWKKRYAELKRRVVDVRANVRRKLLKEGGDEGQKVVAQFDVVAGASSWAKMEYFRAEKEIFRLSPPEETMLGRVIQAKRSIELDRIFDERGETRLSHPGGKGKESLEVWLNEERSIAPEMMKKVEYSADLYFKEMRGQLDQLYREGLLNEEAYEACLEYQHYSPRRFIQHLDPDKPSFDASGRPISIPDSGLKELTTGSEQSMMNNPRLLLMQTMTRTQGRIFRNEANKSLHRYVQENPDNDWVSIQEPKRITKAGAPEYAKAPAGKSPISVVIEGRQQRMLMNNEYAREWLIRDPEISAQLSNTIRILSGGFILRPMATGINPEFAVANLPRDIAHIMLTTQEYSSTLPVGLAQMVKDIGVVGWDAIRRKGRYIDYAREGGLMEFLTHQGRITKEGAEPLRVGFLRGLRNTLEYVGETSEILTRLALRERAIINGKSPQEATWIARNYLDFAQGGSFAKAADAGVPYLNAAVQGTRGIIRAAHQNPGVFTYKVAQIGMLSVGLYLWNRKKNPESWDQISDRQKVSNWIITTPFYKIDENGRKRYKYITIAKDQGQRVFASIFEAMIERIKEGKLPRKQVLASIADFLPFVPTQVLPPTMEAIMGYAMNKDFWYREDIWRGPKVEPKEEFWGKTHPFFVKFGEVTRTSPIRMQYALGNIFTRRNIYTDLGGAGWDIISGAIDDEQHAAVLKKVRDVPFARRLYKETNPMYEDVEELERLSIEENTRRHRQNRELSEIYALTEIEKEELRMAVSEQARKNIYRKRMNERIAEFREFIKKQPAVDRQRLINRRSAMQRHIGLSNWWYDLMELSPESRAAAFYSRWYESDLETRKELIKTAGRIGGIMSGRFMAMFRRLSRES